jgi:hypothetical protein
MVHPKALERGVEPTPRAYVRCYILESLMLKLRTSLSCLISLEVDEETSVGHLLEHGPGRSARGPIRRCAVGRGAGATSPPYPIAGWAVISADAS